MTRIAARWSLVAVLILGAVATTGVLASNSLPATKLGQAAAAVTSNELKPSDCSSVNVTSLVTGLGTITGTGGNDLVLGTSGIDVMNGGAGDDCIIGGAGLDAITGGLGTDVCIGSASATILTCEVVVRR